MSNMFSALAQNGLAKGGQAAQVANSAASIGDAVANTQATQAMEQFKAMTELAKNAAKIAGNAV